MPQVITRPFLQDVAPGAIRSQENHRLTESTVAAPIIATQTLTVAGTEPTIAGDYVVSYTRPSGDTVTVTATAGVFATHEELATAIGAQWEVSQNDWRVEVAADVITLRARNGQQINNITVVAVPGGTTLTASAGTAPSSYELALGLFYAEDTSAGALDQGAFRGNTGIPPTAIRQLGLGDTLGRARGVHAATDNQDQMRPLGAPGPRFLRSGRIGYGLRQGEIGVVVTGANVITPASTIYAVLNPTGGNLVGSALTAEADGANTLALATRARVVLGERNLTIGQQTIRAAVVEML
jgi:hypothetical protein